MKKLFVYAIILVFLLTVTGCGDRKTIDGHTYDTYGLINKDDKRNENIQYELIIGNIVWSVILVESIIAPIYFLGFSIYEPVGKKNTELPKGAVN